MGVRGRPRETGVRESKQAACQEVENQNPETKFGSGLTGSRVNKRCDAGFHKPKAEKGILGERDSSHVKITFKVNVFHPSALK